MMQSGKELNYASDSDNFDIYLKLKPILESLLNPYSVSSTSKDMKILLFEPSHGRKVICSPFFCLPIDTRSASLLDPFFTPLANYSVSHWAGVPENYLTDTPMNMFSRHLQKRRALSKKSESDFNLSASQQSRLMLLPLDKHCKVSLGNY